MCPKPSFINSPTFMLYKLGGSWMEEELLMFVFIDSPWREYRSRESPVVVIIEVLGIRILLLANLQCGRRRMTWIAGFGRSRNYILCGEKDNPLDSIFVWSWSKKLKNFNVTAGLGGQIPLSAWVLEVMSCRKCQIEFDSNLFCFFWLRLEWTNLPGRFVIAYLSLAAALVMLNLSLEPTEIISLII